MLQFIGMKKAYFLIGFIILCLFGGYYVFASSELAGQVRGKILLDVQNNGEAWYVHPLTDERYYLGRPADAFELMRRFGLGVSNKTLGLLPQAEENRQGDSTLRSRLSGRILLQVENNGEAWYMNPDDLRRYYLGRPADAFSVMRNLGLGISSGRLDEIRDGGEVGENIFNTVPFTAQSPFGEWHDLRQEEGCEEASVLMAVSWASKTGFSLNEAKQKILDMADWQAEKYGSFVDTSAYDTASRLLSQYYGFNNYRLEYNVSAADIRRELMRGNLVVIPVNGKRLNNPNFRSGGPQRHMLVVTGYDWVTAEFITNEPGTKYGQDYRYDFRVIDDSLRDYPTGRYAPIPSDAGSAMIVIKP